ncbi:MAG: DsbA family protein [Gemmatimonadota bacterium]|nr:DsbA family protein [Gemmatimonadota bacterium]
MAGQQLKWFYAALGVIVVVGIAALAMARRDGGSGVVEVAPAPVAAGTFAGHVLGSDSAPVTIVEYADFECGACAQFAILTGPDVKQRLVAAGRVRWIFRDFPLDGHRNALAAHLAAACAGEQGRFWDMHDQIFFNHRRWVSERRPERPLRDIARGLNLNLSQYDDCVDSRRLLGQIEAAKREGLERGVQATPTFEVGTLRVSGALSYDSLQALVTGVEARTAK